MATGSARSVTSPHYSAWILASMSALLILFACLGTQYVGETKFREYLLEKFLTDVLESARYTEAVNYMERIIGENDSGLTFLIDEVYNERNSNQIRELHRNLRRLSRLLLTISNNQKDEGLRELSIYRSDHLNRSFHESELKLFNITCDKLEKSLEEILEKFACQKGFTEEIESIKAEISLFSKRAELLGGDFAEFITLRAAPVEPDIHDYFYSSGVFVGLPKIEGLNDGIPDLVTFKEILESLRGAVKLEYHTGISPYEQFMSRINQIRGEGKSLLTEYDNTLQRREIARENLSTARKELVELKAKGARLVKTLILLEIKSGSNIPQSS